MKIIDKQQSEQEEVSYETEINILKKVRHPNIIGLFDVHEGKDKIYLVMELVTGGELFDRIVEKGHFTEDDAAYIVRKILEAVDYLHNMGIAHRDLKPENLLLSDATENARVMISDFGLSKVLTDEAIMKTACGTPGYVAPEVLSYVGYGKEVDLWSVGVIAYVLLCGYAPFFGEKDSDLFAAIMGAVYEFDSPYWDDISDEAKDFINKLLQVDIKKRSTTREALNHPWVKKTLNRQGSIQSSLHPSHRTQLYRTTSQKVKKEQIKETVDAAIGIRRKGTTKKEQEENAERRKKAIEEKKQLEEEEEADEEVTSFSATLRAKLGLKSKKDKENEKDKKKGEEKEEKGKRKSKA